MFFVRIWLRQLTTICTSEGKVNLVKLIFNFKFWNFISFRRLIDDVESFTSTLFLSKFCTSAICICASVYCLAFVFTNSEFHQSSLLWTQLPRSKPWFSVIYVLLFPEYHWKLYGADSDNPHLRVFYNIPELFVITYYGNEIMLASNRLTHTLFESDWIEQPLSTKKLVVIFGEYLRQPHVLMIGKLYPLTLETFNKVCLTCNRF